MSPGPNAAADRIVGASPSPDASADAIVDGVSGSGSASDVSVSPSVAGGSDAQSALEGLAELAGGIHVLTANDVDVDVPAQAGVTVVLFTAITAPRVVNLPAAAAHHAQVIIKDTSGQASGSHTITAVPLGGDSIEGDNAVSVLDALDEVLSLVSDFATAWYDVTDRSPALVEIAHRFGVSHLEGRGVASHLVLGTLTIDGGLVLGTALQNLGYDMLVQVTIPVTAAAGGSIVAGTGYTPTPTTDPVTPALTGAQTISFSMVVGGGESILVDKTGSITCGTPVVVATAL